jgi:DNA-binding response OmpR family regulator
MIGNNKILIINNDMDAMSLLQTWLERKGYNVRFTEDAGSVNDLIHEFKPQLIIVDILQREVAENLKFNNEVKSVLLMKGYTLKSKKNDLAVDDIVEKPFNLPLLEKKVFTLMNKKIA